MIWMKKRGRYAENPARAMTMYPCQHEPEMRLADIATRVGLKHYAGALFSIRKFQQRLDRDPKLQKRLKVIKLDLIP